MVATIAAVGIPVPTDSYDHENCNKANVTSIRALIAAFDASMDSLHNSINIQMAKLDDISKRVEACQQQWSDVGVTTIGDDDDNVKMFRINIPSNYEDVIRGSCEEAFASPIESALVRARDEANAAIRSILREEAMTFETTAKPSDAWLDRGAGFDRVRACRIAQGMHSVPPLVLPADNSVKGSRIGSFSGENVSTSNSSTCGDGTSASASEAPCYAVVKEEIKYYKEGIAHLHEMKNPSQTQHNNRNQPQHASTPTPDDEGSILMNQSYMSEYTGRGTLYTHCSEGTASHRRRQRKLAASMRRKNAMDGGGGGGGSGDDPILRRVGSGGSVNMQHVGSGAHISSSRQHLMSGSLPYVCEMIHDTHQLGSIRDGAVGHGNVFPEVKDLCDLFIHGTNDLAYSLARDVSSASAVQKVGDGKSSGNRNSSAVRRRMKGNAHGDGEERKSSSPSELFQLAEDEEAISGE